MEYNFDVLKEMLSTSIISDVLDELGVEGMLSYEFEPNYFEAKVCGRAKTIKVEKIKEGEDPKGIYKGLEIYNIINKGDVIVVANEVKKLAFWGELNSNLAIRSGAVGTIVDSVTRDNFQTRKLGYPVFAKGRYAKDIKNRGIIKELNVPVKIDGIRINPGDFVFADVDGVVIVPREIEKEVLIRAIYIAETEKAIISDVAKMLNVEDLVKKHGFF